ncbi:MAG TPA: TetR family transcriptional regulator [Nitrolancea sp.]|nr:TetR family transcriptional regulator [Nitrolancea sp.]
MSSPPADERVTTSLRERKKARTRAEIQRQALRLFREQGFAETTVEQIAAAAEVSPSTFFRYFPTKEDVVLRDDYDELLLEAFAAQPAELNPIQALRAAMRATAGRMTPEELEQEARRQRLVLATPELYPRMLSESTRTIQTLTAAIARRTGRSPDDFAAQVFTGAVIGVALSAWLAATESEADFWPLMDRALAYLEAGLPLAAEPGGGDASNTEQEAG